MQDARKKFGCPKCHGVIKVPLKYLGKRIKCPKCSFVFRAGAKPVEEEIVAELEEVQPSMPDPGFMDPMPPFDAPPMQPLASSQPLPPSRPATPYRSQVARKQTKRRNEMTEFDTKLQSSGIFLLILPVIATVLPLAGLQLRRLAKLGEFAPLGAMVAGLIGVGTICYARRNQGDAPLLGSAAGLFVLVTGIGGFFLVSALSPSQSNGSDRFPNQYSDVTGNQPSSSAEEAMAKAEAAHKEFIQEAEKREQAFNDRQREQHKQMRTDINRQMREGQDFHNQAMEDHRKAMENMQGGFQTPPNMPKPNFGSGFGGRRN